MLKKLLKYDFLPVYRYWWIAAVSVILLSVFSGIGLSAQLSGRMHSSMIDMLSVLGTMLMVLAYGAFAVFSAILVYGRFYKNFFTDEGYLTFTLPVKHSVLLNSKIILSMVTTIATGFVIFLSLGLFFSIGLFSTEFGADLSGIFSEGTLIFNETAAAYILIFILEFILFALLSTLLSCLCIFVCITIAGILVKKAKILAAIGIYYGAKVVYSFNARIISYLVLDRYSYRTHFMSDQEITRAMALLGLGIIVLTAIGCALLYVFEHWMLSKKLNLE